MYGWIWRRLPDPWAMRVLTALLLALGVVALLMAVVFPWAATVWPVDQPDLRESVAGTAPVAAPAGLRLSGVAR